MSFPSCILCGTNAHVVLLYPSTVHADDLNAAVFSARRMPDRIHEEIVRCTRCGLIFPNHLIDASVLRRLYESSTHDYGAMEEVIQKTYMRYVHRALSFLTHSRPWKSLDIGCGNGFMLSALRAAGCDAWGLEPSTDSIAQADPTVRSHIMQGMASAETLVPNEYDLITCFQTLDHLPDPISFVRQCYTALKPGGVVLFINHDTAAWTARILGERSPIIDIEHTYLHTKKTMQTLFAENGFTGITVFSVRNDYPLWYWMHLLPLPGKKWLYRIAKKSRFGRIIIPLYAGNLGLIAVKNPKHEYSKSE